MKLVTFIRNGSEKEELGLLRGERVLPLEELGFSYTDMNELILPSPGRCRTLSAWGSTTGITPPRPRAFPRTPSAWSWPRPSSSPSG